MSRVRIVTDSTAELSPELARELDIVVVPLHIRLGLEAFDDSPDLRSAEFYRRTGKSKSLAAVVAPTTQEFAQVYAQLAKATDQILSIHLGARFGKAVQAAKAGREEFWGQSQIQVLDSQLISRPLGIIVAEAARAAQSGANLPDIVRSVRGLITRVYCALYTEDLSVLKRVGMLPLVPEGIGMAPHIKPILILEEGELTPLQRLRNRGTPVERLTEFTAEFTAFQEVTVLHSGLSQGTADLIEQLRLLYPEQSIGEHIYGPMLANYVGPDALGVVVFEAATSGSLFY